MATSRSKRFDEKRDQIIACATALLNERGVRGMTLADVAAAAGIVPTSVAYYFGKKEALAAACFEVGIERLERLVLAAAAEPTVRERLSALWRSYFDLRLRIARGYEPPIPMFSDVRTLSEPWFTQVAQRHVRFFQATIDLFKAPEMDWLQGRAATARANIVIEHIRWLSVWLPRHEIEEYPRLCDRMLDILLNGLAMPDAAWAPKAIDLRSTGDVDDQAVPDALMIAATRLINQFGYKGASVDKISAALQRTKGAFYHHIDGKDELVMAGFARTFDILNRAHNRALALDGDTWTRLHSIVAALADFQVSEEGPLMRISARQSLPEAMRAEVLHRSDKLTRRFSGLISDGAAEGSLRPVDPMIASHMLTAAINSVADRHLARRDPELEHAPLQYALPMLYGILYAPPGR
jgi:AcrR family transcriptional regulator